MRAAGLALLGAFATAAPSAAQAVVPAGTELAVRLATPVASHSARVGDPVDAVLIAPVESAGRPMVSAGARIRGRVTLVRKVGFGVRREKASLGVVFDAIDFGEGAWRRLDAAVARVDNARERVDRGGVIRGIRATAGPGTRATSRLRHLPSLGLYPDPALLAYKVVFPWFPNPEVVLPAGAELSLRLKAPLRAPEEAVRDYPEFDSEELLELANLVRRVPVRAYASDPARPADMTNVLLSGAEETVRAAFERAGWVGADGKSPASVGRTVKAIVVHDAYRRAPMSELLVAGRSPDLLLQKGGNSYEKRHHIRLWRYGTWRSNPLWVGAATHDIAVGLDWRRMRLTHRIDARIDSERDKVVHDLLFTACADAVEWLERPAAPVRTVTATGEPVLTAGTIAALRLPACPEVDPGAMAGAAPQWGNAFTRYLRRQVLVVRSDLLRANIIWSAYDVGRLAWLGIRGRRAAAEHWPTLGPATGPTGSPLPPD